MEHVIPIKHSGAGHVISVDSILADAGGTRNEELYFGMSCNTGTSLGVFLNTEEMEELMLVLAIRLRECGVEFVIQRKS